MAAANLHRDIKGDSNDSATLHWENRMLLSTSYPLDATASKRIQIGLRATGRPERAFKPAIELSASTGEGIRFDFYSWCKFRDNMGIVGAYLRGDSEEIPQGRLLYENALNFTTFNGSRAIILFPRTCTLEKYTTAVPMDAEVNQHTLKKQKLYTRGIMIQRDDFEELEKLIECISAKHSQLELLEDDARECSTSLMWHIAHRVHKLPKTVSVNSDLMRKILTDNYREIKIQMEEEFKEETEFSCRTYIVLFCELSTFYFNYIAEEVIKRYFSVNST